MKISVKFIFLFSFGIIALLFAQVGKTASMHPGNKDSLVKQTDNYIQYVNGIGAHGERFISTYIKIARHKQYLPAPGYDYWPDSIELTTNVTKYKNEPVEYSETPLNVPSGTNLEYDNYYYKGKLLAYRIFEVLSNSVCTGGTLTNSRTIYYDSTGKVIKDLHTVSGSNSQPVDTVRCAVKIDDFSHLYKTYSETPLAKEGIEGKTK